MGGGRGKLRTYFGLRGRLRGWRIWRWGLLLWRPLWGWAFSCLFSLCLIRLVEVCGLVLVLVVDFELGWLAWNAELLGGEVIFCQGGEGRGSFPRIPWYELEPSGRFKKFLKKNRAFLINPYQMHSRAGFKGVIKGSFPK